MPGSSGSPWVISVEEELAKVGAKFDSDKCSIRLVPQLIRSLKADMYKPAVLPLGLYNRDFSKVTPIEKLKLEVVNVFLKHVNMLGPGGWKTFCAEVANPPPNAQTLEHFYDDPPSDPFINPEVVRSVLTIDAVFIVSVFGFVRDNIGFTAFPDSPSAFCEDIQKIFGGSRMRSNQFGFLSDIGTFENQIPLFLIKNVLRTITNWTEPAVDRLFDNFLREILWIWTEQLGLPSVSPIPSGGISFESCEHVLACLHKVICQETRSNPASEAGCFQMCAAILIHTLIFFSSGVWKAVATLAQNLKLAKRGEATSHKSVQSNRIVPTASQLQKAGIRIRGIKTSASDIKFVTSFFSLTATIYLPTLIFDEFLERSLRNVCVYELLTTTTQTLMPYLWFMDNLINTEEDVQLLRKGDSPVIVANDLGDDKKVADLINNLLQHYTFSPGNLGKITDDIHSWNDSKWRHYLFRFLEEYVRAPWLLKTLTAATLLLVATILQTVYTMKAFYKS